MLYTCDKCGKVRADKIIDPEHNLAICPECGYSKPFKCVPLFAVGGACGTGKTAICKAIAGRLDRVIAIEGDSLWDMKRFSPFSPEEYFEYALRVAMNISQSGVLVAFFHSGFGIPGNLENCVARRYFSEIHYLGLYCSDQEIERRLYQRPSLRGESGRLFVDTMKGFNSVFRYYDSDNTAYPHVDKIDTSDISLEEATALVESWIKSRIR